MFDPSLLTVSVLGVPLIFVIIGMVTFMRQLGLVGRGLTVASLVWGLVIGVGYQISVLGVPLDFAGWWAIIIYGIGLGLLAALFYDTFKGVIERAIEHLVNSLQ